jgi:hypothetical protein
MSNDFKKVLVKDDRLMVTDSLNYGVIKGGQNVTNVRMPAISATPNNLNFTIPFPSENTVLDREVYLRTTTIYDITFDTAIPGVPYMAENLPTTAPNYSARIAYACPLVYGYNISVGSFSTQRTMDTIQVQINNNVSTINSSDVLPALLRLSDCEIWETENMAAASVDRLAWNKDENDFVNCSNMAGYDQVQGNKSLPNGCNPNQLVAYSDSTYNTVITNYPAAGTKYFKLFVNSTEPLIAPPFIWNRTQSNRQGIYGLQNMSVVCNYGNINKAIKISSTAGIVNKRNGGATAYPWFAANDPDYFFPAFTMTQQIYNAELQMKYITPHGNDVVPVRNVIPLLEYPRFITSSTQYGSIGFAYLDSQNGVNYNGGLVQDGINSRAGSAIQSNTFTFNQVPDKLIIFVRPDAAYRNKSYSNDWVYPISNISIQWNNHSGLLANASQEQLFHMSREAGSNQDWESFQGIANVVYQRSAGQLGHVFAGYPSAQPSGATPSSSTDRVYTQTTAVSGSSFESITGSIPTATQVQTIGSYLVLDLAKHLELAEPWNAPGSLGSFQLQFNVTINAYNLYDQNGVSGYGTDSVEASPEVVVIPVNSGIMVTERGQTSCYTGILTKSDVLDASLQEPYGHMEIKRIVGHGHGDSSKALPSRCHPKARHSKHSGMSNSMDNRLM